MVYWLNKNTALACYVFHPLHIFNLSLYLFTDIKICCVSVFQEEYHALRCGKLHIIYTDYTVMLKHIYSYIIKNRFMGPTPPMRAKMIVFLVLFVRVERETIFRRTHIKQNIYTMTYFCPAGKTRH